VISVYEANRVTINPLKFYHAYKIRILCAITGVQAKPGEETLVVNFFDLKDLPYDQICALDIMMLEYAFGHFNDPA